VVPLKRSRFEPGQTLPLELTLPEPVLYTRRNVALAATHLAAILGASQIVYVGVEQTNAAHFFSYEPDTQALMRQDAEKLRDVAFLDIDHPSATHAALIAKADSDAQTAEQEPFYKDSHAQTFREYFTQLRALGIGIVSTASESVVLEAGGDYRELAVCL
jgi:hypothetical protein